MPRPIVMPSMGMYTEEGVLTAWLRPGGARVEAGEPIVEITTEKATFEIPAPAAGILHPVAEVGTNLRVEALMGYILAEGEKTPAATVEKADAAPPSREASYAGSAPQESQRVARMVRASPAARRLAAQHGIDLTQLAGSGPGGRVVEADVLAGLAQRDATAVNAPSAGRRIRKRVPLVGLRRTIAERLRHSLATAASTTLTREADTSTLVAARQHLAEKRGDALPYDALFIKLLAAALRERPELNAILESDSIVLLEEVHVGFAVALPGGLVVPVVHDADSAPLEKVVRAVQELSDRARTGRLRPADVEGGTATITNLGGFGIDAFTPILNAPQSVILGIGRIAERPVVRDAALTVGQTCILSLTFDHRIADGVPAAQLLDAVVRRMNDEQFFTALA
jgi:pyruvate dehydrogenase E2 component (dihydrolipoamide acetyltransferase)